MKRIITSVVLSLLWVSFLYTDEIPLPRVTVYGTATTEVAPDEMNWTLTVKNKGMSLETVATEHATNVQTVLRSLRTLKVDAKTVQTSNMEFGENWEEKGDAKVRQGYFASSEIAFKISDFELYKAVWLGLARVKAVSVDSVTYNYSKRIDLQNETRQRALLAAKEKAVVLARTLGAEIGEPLLIEEETEFQDYYRNSNVQNNLRIDSAAEFVSSGMLAIGKIPITMRVKAAFRLVSAAK